MPPVPRDPICTNLQSMRFVERNENEVNSKDTWQTVLGQYLYMRGGREGHFSEYGQRAFNLSEQIKRPFPDKSAAADTFFEGMKDRKLGHMKRESPAECYARQTGLHFRNPLPYETPARLKAVDHSAYATPIFSERSANLRARSTSPGGLTMPYYLAHERTLESWGRNADCLRNAGREVWWRRAYSEESRNTDTPRMHVDLPSHLRPRFGFASGDLSSFHGPQQFANTGPSKRLIPQPTQQQGSADAG